MKNRIDLDGDNEKRTGRTGDWPEIDEEPGDRWNTIISRDRRSTRRSPEKEAYRPAGEGSLETNGSSTKEG